MMSTSRWCGNANKAWLILRTTTDSVAHICLDFRQHGQQVLSWIQMTMHGCDSQPSQAETLEGPVRHTLHGLYRQNVAAWAGGVAPQEQEQRLLEVWQPA